jgi:hypothetical protein
MLNITAFRTQFSENFRLSMSVFKLTVSKLFKPLQFSLVTTLSRFILDTGLTDTKLGRAIAQAVSGRLPIAAVRVQTRVWSCGIL